MAYNALDELRRAGVVTPRTSKAALSVLGELSEEEAKFISSLDARIKSAMAPEVVAHSEEGDEDAPCIGFSCTGYSHDVV